MIKKFIIASLATVLTVGTCLPAVTAEAAVNSDKYLGQTVDSNGKYQGWYKFSDGSWGYYIDYGKLVKNVWVNEPDGDYGIGADGKMVTGWFPNAIDNKWYYFQSNGKASKGWLQSDGLWYYMDNKGAMLTGWQKINERWYYFDTTTGVMASNIKVDGYYLSADGSLQ